jgi:hypothetical protein
MARDARDCGMVAVYASAVVSDKGMVVVYASAVVRMT